MRPRSLSRRNRARTPSGDSSNCEGDFTGNIYVAKLTECPVVDWKSLIWKCFLFRVAAIIALPHPSQHVIKPRQDQRDGAVFDDVVGGAVALLDVLFDVGAQLVDRLIRGRDPRDFALRVRTRELADHAEIERVGDRLDRAPQLRLLDVAEQDDAHHVGLVDGAVQIGRVEQQFLAVAPHMRHTVERERAFLRIGRQQAEVIAQRRRDRIVMPAQPCARRQHGEQRRAHRGNRVDDGAGLRARGFRGGIAFRAVPFEAIEPPAALLEGVVAGLVLRRCAIEHARVAQRLRFRADDRIGGFQLIEPRHDAGGIGRGLLAAREEREQKVQRREQHHVVRQIPVEFEPVGVARISIGEGGAVNAQHRRELPLHPNPFRAVATLAVTNTEGARDKQVGQAPYPGPYRREM